jgi:hypothetical protein
MLAKGVSSSRKVNKRSLNDSESFGEERLLQSISRLERALLETQKKGDLVEESRLCNNIAKLYEQLGEFRSALNYHLYDKQISVAAGDTEGALLALSNMSQVFTL